MCSRASDGFVTRRRLLGVAGLVGIGSLMAACMPAAQPPAPTKAAETKPAEAKPAATVASAAAPAASKGPVELVFWTFMPTAARFAGRPELFKRWGEKANATVKVEELDNNDIHTKLLAGKASGVLPDILDPAESPRVNNWAQIGVLADVSRVLKELGQDDFWKPAVDAVSFDGKIWSIPFVGFPHLLYYRKDMLTEKGLKPPTNWDEMEQVAKALTGKDKAGQEISGTVGFFAIHHALFFWQNMVGPNNGFTWDKADKEKPMFPAKENLEAMNYVKRLVPYMQKGAESMNYGNTNTFFFEGKCATTLSSTSFANGLYKTKPELAPNVGSAPVPKGPSSDGKRGAANGVSYYGWTPQSKHQELLYDLMKWFFTKENYLEGFRTIDFGLIPQRKSVVEDPQYKKFIPEVIWHVPENGRKAAEINTFPGEDWGPNPFTNFLIAKKTYNDLLIKIYTGEQPDAALKWAQGEAEKIVKENR